MCFHYTIPTAYVSMCIFFKSNTFARPGYWIRPTMYCTWWFSCSDRGENRYTTHHFRTGSTIKRHIGDEHAITERGDTTFFPHAEVSWNRGTVPLNHPFWGTPIPGNHPCVSVPMFWGESGLSEKIWLRQLQSYLCRRRNLCSIDLLVRVSLDPHYIH